MAPNKASTPPYSKDEKVLCFHHEMLYEAKVLEAQQMDDGGFQYKIHYKGWKNTWDDWVPQDRIRKFNDENRELASQLMQAARASQQKNSKPAKKAGLKNGSDFSSARGSEERTGGAAAMTGRGPRRARDFDLEHFGDWPRDLIDPAAVEKEAKWFKAGKKYDFTSPPRNTRDRYVKMGKEGPEFNDPPPIHQSSDVIELPPKRGGRGAASKPPPEHPKIAAARNANGGEVPAQVEDFWDGVHPDHNPQLAGIPPADRDTFNQEIQEFQRANGGQPLRNLPDPAGKKKRSLKQAANKLKKQALGTAKPTRVSSRLKDKENAAQETSTAEMMLGKAVQDDATMAPPSGTSIRTTAAIDMASTTPQSEFIVKPKPNPASEVNGASKPAADSKVASVATGSAAANNSEPIPAFKLLPATPKSAVMGKSTVPNKSITTVKTVATGKSSATTRSAGIAKAKSTTKTEPTDALTPFSVASKLSEDSKSVATSKSKSTTQSASTNNPKSTSAIPRAAAPKTAVPTNTAAPKSTGKGKRSANNIGMAPSKRPRINQACNMCRIKKTRCDGDSPCEACSKRDFKCVYADGLAELNESTRDSHEGAPPSGGPSGGPQPDQDQASNSTSNDSATHTLVGGSAIPPSNGGQGTKRKREEDTAEAEMDVRPTKVMKTTKVTLHHPSREAQQRITRQLDDSIQKFLQKFALVSDAPSSQTKKLANRGKDETRPAKLQCTDTFKFEVLEDEKIKSMQNTIAKSLAQFAIDFKPLQSIGQYVLTGRLEPEIIDIQIQEESFHSRPSIKLVLPDHIKGFLVDDWENVTKNNQLVHIPHPKPVETILQDYLAAEKPNREEDSTQMDILEETIAGLREYFDRALGRILLYRFERKQYADQQSKWAGENNKEGPSTTYGAEHLSRLLVSLPELIAQTNMDQQSVGRLREELTKFTNWLGKNYATYWQKEYETPDADYLATAKSG